MGAGHGRRWRPPFPEGRGHGVSDVPALQCLLETGLFFPGMGGGGAAWIQGARHQ